MKKITPVLLIIALVFVLAGCGMWSGMINKMMPSNSRPAKVTFDSDKVTAAEFDKLGEELTNHYTKYEFNHIENFKEAGILSYEGPQTCLTCHRKIEIVDAVSGKTKKVDLMRNLTTSSHYRFYTERHPNVYGFNGELADNFKMGKINRPCPKPGSFAMTAWAAPVVVHGDTLSEGCGQCHIGGQPTAPLGEMMPGYRTKGHEKDAIDCLICHAVAYDMNRKQVRPTDDDRWYWDQDRTMRAAMSVSTPTAQACLRCHQHNLGGDIYIDTADTTFFQSMINQGHERPRIAHPGSKRGTPYSPSWDVHAAAGLECIECHTTEGHYIAKGTHTTTMMANDLPFTEVACENCHTTEPHSDIEYADTYNEHFEKIACQTCHIPSLQADNATYRDFNTPMYEEHPGLYVYTDTKKETEPGKGIVYAWWNGDGTFLGNPIGDNPNGKNLYKFYDPQFIWPEYEDYDYNGWYEETMRPIAKKRPSKIYGMKLFNGRQHIDLANIGPFGGMYLPYNLPTYYKTGDPDEAAKAEMQHSMMKRMYGYMFKAYMMEKFMSFMDIDGWNTCAYDDASELKNVEARWIPQDALLEMSHAIRKDGALNCTSCHSQNGVMDFEKLGYDAEEVESLKEDRL